MTAWTLEPIGGPWFVAAVAAALASLLAVGSTTRFTSRRKRFTLGLLRCVTLLLLLFMMLRPAIEYRTTQRLPGSLIVLADQSRSMQVTDSLDNASRWDALRKALANSADKFSELAAAWDLHAYAFGERTRPVEFEDGRFDLPEEADASQSAIGAALDDVLASHQQQRIVGVLLLSDGAQRAFAPRDLLPQLVVRRMAADSLPLYTFAFGQPSLGERPDLRLSDLLINDAVFVDTPAEAKGMLAVNGYANQTFNVQLLWEDANGEMQAVDTRRITVEPGRRRYPIALSYTPQESGEYKVTLRVESPEGELVTANNLQSTFVSVLKGGVKVLYLVGSQRIGGGPDEEPYFVRRALSGFPDLNVQYRLLTYHSPEFDLREQLRDAKYDVFLLGNVDVTALDNRAWRDMAEYVDNGAGLGMLGGFHSFGPGGFRESPLRDVLPIEMDRTERQQFDEPIRTDVHVPGPLQVVPVVWGGGQDAQVHPILRLSENAADTQVWSDLPTLTGANRFSRLRLKPTAVVVAEANDAQRTPLLVVSTYGAGRTAALAVDSTWLWQLGGRGDVHRRFWRQLVLWLARKDDTAGRRVWVRLDQRRYQQGARVNFSLGASNEQGEPIVTAEYEARVEKPDGTVESVRVVPGAENPTASFADTSAPGDYRVTVQASQGGQPLGDAAARFSVSDQDIELDQPAAEPTFLSALARMTADAGGAGLAPEELPSVLDQLQNKTNEFEEEIIRRITLWDTWPTLLAFVGLLSTEWFLRKRWGMA